MGKFPVPGPGKGRLGGRDERVYFWRVMNTPNESSSDPILHAHKIQRQLTQLIDHARADLNRVAEPRFKALLADTTEVLTGLKTAFQEYGGKRPAWPGRPDEL